MSTSPSKQATTTKTAQPTALRERYPRRLEVPILILAAGALLGVGLSAPLFKVTQMIFWKDDYSVLTGAAALYQEQEYFLAVIIVLFSVIFPIVKLATLWQIWMMRMTDARRAATLHWLGFLGKWSMLDVMVVALTIVAVKLEPLARVEPRHGLYIFSAAIFLSLVATTHVERLARHP